MMTKDEWIEAAKKHVEAMRLLLIKSDDEDLNTLYGEIEDLCYALPANACTNKDETCPFAVRGECKQRDFLAKAHKFWEY
jgi:hypothetical protein